MPRAKFAIRSHLCILGSVNVRNNLEIARAGLTHQSGRVRLRNREVEEIENLSVGISEYPARNGEILPNFDFILPKFDFILPKFHFAPRWKIFVVS